MSRTDKQAAAPDAWKRQLLEARQRACDALSECAGPHIDNWAAADVAELVQFAHAQVLAYHRHIAAQADELPSDGLWDEQLMPVRVPKTQSLDGGMTDWYGEYDLEDITEAAEMENKPVSLASLREEWSQRNRAVVTVELLDRGTGQQITEKEDFDLHLPPAACEAVLAQLDKCLDELGWLPEITNNGDDGKFGRDDVMDMWGRMESHR